MIKKLFIVLVLLTLALSACGGAGAEETATPAATDTQIATAVPATTQAPAVTETLTSTPDGTAVTATPTVGTVAPTNPPDCTNSASFVADVTIPDNTNVAAGTSFTKTWRIGNNGTCVWGPDYSLAYYSEERMGAADSVPLGITYPGQTLDVSVELTAPNTAGKHQANFVIENPAGLIMRIGEDSRLWVVIDVTVGGTATATVAASATAAPAGSATATSGGVVIATLVSTFPAATVAATATRSSSSSAATTCLPSIDRTKLMETIIAINAYRAEKGLAEFRVSPKLAQAAQRHAADMACKDITDHTGSDNSTPQTRVSATGYQASAVAENIYSSSPPFTGQGVVNWWITDPADTGHNANLLSTNFTEIGVGYALLENSGYYVVVFAKP